MAARTPFSAAYQSSCFFYHTNMFFTIERLCVIRLIIFCFAYGPSVSLPPMCHLLTKWQERQPGRIKFPQQLLFRGHKREPCLRPAIFPPLLQQPR